MSALAKLHPPAEPNKTPRAKDLKNQAMLVRPGQKYVTEDGADGKPWKYVECTVVTLDRQGIVEQYDDVRISWVRTQQQLEASKGQWLAVKPVDTGEGVVLVGLEGQELAIAERVVGELTHPDGQRELLDDEDAPPPDDADVPSDEDELL
jgi:hypothetical protein